MTARDKITVIDLSYLLYRTADYVYMSVCFVYGLKRFRKGEIKAIRCRRSIQIPPRGCCYYTVQKDGILPTKHAPHVLMPVPRRSQSCNCLLHSAALCARFSVSDSLTTLEYKTVRHEMRRHSSSTNKDSRALPTVFGGNNDPSCTLRTRVTEVEFCKVSRSLEGRLAPCFLDVKT